jgi:hypothetical protein
MFVPHPHFRVTNNNQMIWRYMDFTKFASLLINSALFFTKSNKFEDPFEGRYSELNRIFRDESLDSDQNELFISGLFRFNENVRKNILINCWHMNDYESAGMWKFYSSNEGIAIQTSTKNLCDSFQKTEEEIFIGEVDYIDHNIQALPMRNGLDPFFFKRKSFEHEKEIRAIIWINRKQDNALDHENDGVGTNIKIDLNILIERVYISPYAPSWIKDIVIEMLNIFKLEKEVIQSVLYKIS